MNICILELSSFEILELFFKGIWVILELLEVIKAY